MRASLFAAVANAMVFPAWLALKTALLTAKLALVHPLPALGAAAALNGAVEYLPAVLAAVRARMPRRKAAGVTESLAVAPSPMSRGSSANDIITPGGNGKSSPGGGALKPPPTPPAGAVNLKKPLGSK